MPFNEQWLEKVIEDPIDPEIPIIDPHHHLWETANTHVDKPYMREDLISDLDFVSTLRVSTTAILA